MAQSVYRLATGWMIRGSDPGGREALGFTQLRIQWLPGLLPGGKAAEAIPLLRLRAFMACSRVSFTFTFTIKCQACE